MVKKVSTEENLLIVTNENLKKRRSLVLDDDYNGADGRDQGQGQGLGHGLGSSGFGDEGSAKLDGEDKGSEEDLLPPALSSNEELKHVVQKIDDLKKETSARKSRPRRRRKGKAETEAEAEAEAGEDTEKELKSKKKDKDDKDETYRSRFGDVKFNSVLTTIFDSPSFKKSDFFGFFVLFWLGTAFLMVNNLVHSSFVSSESLLDSYVVQTMRKDLIKIGITDLFMYLGTYVAYFIQYGCVKKIIHWELSGWKLQSGYDFVYAFFWLYVASDQCMAYPWIGKVFLLLHSLVFVMKMHSYGYYNGYLWKVYGELEFSSAYLKRLNSGEVQPPKDYDLEATKKVLEESVRFCTFELEYQSKATTLNTDIQPSEFEANCEFKDDLQELHNKHLISFPKNITFKNYFDYTMFPTLVYTLNYPRTPRIRWGYVFEKTCAIFGIIFLMVLVAQNQLYPIVQRATACRTLPTSEKWKNYLFILLDMIPPFLMEYLFTFFLIWEAILNTIAELSRFADRDFYGPWWSCTDWSEYSRIWNRPVHNFLLRHVYHSSISALKLNKFQAIMMTFILSSVIHELVMFVIFGTLRGYLLLFQMSQIPLVMLSNTHFMRDKKVLGNVICWVGFISGPSMICTLYLIF